MCSLLIGNANISLFAEESINNLQGEVETATSKIEDNNQEIEVQEAKVDELNDEIADLETQIDDIKNEFAVNEEKRLELVTEIEAKESELKDLNKDLKVRKDTTSSLLVVLQRNKNINFIVEVASDDEIGLSDKIRTISVLNQLSLHTVKKLELTIDLIEKVRDEKNTLKKSNEELEKQQAELESQGTELSDKAEEQYELKEEALVTITSLKAENSSEKTKLLDTNNLIDDYELAGCSGDDVYGSDCATDEATTESSSSGGSYVEKLRADPDANYIINRESGWDPYATNPYSGAYGICQSLPGTKMASAGSDWKTNIETQAKWCDSYVAGRYGTWADAHAFWDAHHWF